MTPAELIADWRRRAKGLAEDAARAKARYDRARFSVGCALSNTLANCADELERAMRDGGHADDI